MGPDAEASFVTVHLVRHGETRSYATDAPLTQLGRSQAASCGRHLASSLPRHQPIRIVHSPRLRAAETANVLWAALRDQLTDSRTPSAPNEAHLVTAPIPAVEFDNFRAYCGGEELEVTAAFPRLEAARQRSAACAVRSPWVLEADRFWDRFEADADPIEFWLTQPMQFFEPAALVVRRFWRGIVARSAPLLPGTQLIVCTHSGPIRALAAQAIGYDPGEPDHLESLHVVLDRARHRASVKFREATMEAGIPTDETPSWFASEG